MDTGVIFQRLAMLFVGVVEEFYLDKEHSNPTTCHAIC